MEIVYEDKMIKLQYYGKNIAEKLEEFDFDICKEYRLSLLIIWL